MASRPMLLPDVPSGGSGCCSERQDMPRYFLGVDVGSTKTHALIADEMGRALGLGASGPGNPDGVGHEGLTAVLREAIARALAAARIEMGQIAGAGFGIGGYDWPSQRDKMLGSIRATGLDAPVEIVNDAMLGVLAGTTDGWGVAVVAGTSCNCWGRDRNRREGRMTGFSWMGEAAGAGELVLKAIQAVARAWTWRGPATRLTQAFVELAGARDVVDLLEGLSSDRIHVGADAAPLVFCIAAEGDPVAQDLIVWAGRELADMAIGVIHQLGLEPLEFEVVMAGSFFKGSPRLAEVMRETIHTVAPGARLVRLHVPPVVGGVVLGMEQGGMQPSHVRQALLESIGKLLRYDE
jgi:N-acetylglucosamine kinase-like BadF-type ATPase